MITSLININRPCQKRSQELHIVSLVLHCMKTHLKYDNTYFIVIA